MKENTIILTSRKYDYTVTFKIRSINYTGTFYIKNKKAFHSKNNS